MYLDRFDVANLAAVVLGLPEPEEDDDVDEVEDKFVNEYEMNLDTFAELMGKLLPLCAEGVSPLTPTLKQQALDVLNEELMGSVSPEGFSTILKALEQLPGA